MSFRRLSGGGGGVDPSDSTATQADLLAGKTAYIVGGKVTGSMTDRGTVNITPGTTPQTILGGKHSGSGSVAGDADLIAANIRKDTDVFGVVGTLEVNPSTADATAAAGDIVNPKTAYVAGAKITGSMVDRGTVNITPSTVDQTIAAGKHSGTGKVSGDANLLALNIKNAVNIFGVIGTYDYSAAPAAAADITSGKEAFVNGVKVTGSSTAKKFATGNLSSSSTTLSFTTGVGGSANYNHVTVSGLTFTPSTIILKETSTASGRQATIYNTDDLYYISSSNHAPIVTAGMTANFRLDGTNAYVNGTGFRLPVNISSANYTWYAYE